MVVARMLGVSMHVTRLHVADLQQHGDCDNGDREAQELRTHTALALVVCADAGLNLWVYHVQCEGQETACGKTHEVFLKPCCGFLSRKVNHCDATDASERSGEVPYQQRPHWETRSPQHHEVTEFLRELVCSHRKSCLESCSGTSEPRESNGDAIHKVVKHLDQEVRDARRFDSMAVLVPMPIAKLWDDKEHKATGDAGDAYARHLAMIDTLQGMWQKVQQGICDQYSTCESQARVLDDRPYTRHVKEREKGNPNKA